MKFFVSALLLLLGAHCLGQFVKPWGNEAWFLLAVILFAAGGIALKSVGGTPHG